MARFMTSELSSRLVQVKSRVRDMKRIFNCRKENQLMKHPMLEAPGIISHTARFVNIISFSSPPFPPLLFPSPKSRPRRRKGASGQNYRIRFSGFFNLPPPRRKGGRQTGERERQSLSEWLWQQLARRQINRDEDGCGRA